MKGLTVTLVRISLVSMLLITAAGIIVLISNRAQNRQTLEKTKNLLMNDYDLLVKSQVQSAISALHEIEISGLALDLTPDERMKQAADVLRKMKYLDDQSGYFFADTVLGTNIVNNGSPSEGKFRQDIKDSDGVLLILELQKNALKGGGYLNYRFPRAGSTVPELKRSYSQLFEPYQWVIGTGNYLQDIDMVMARTKTELNTAYYLNLAILSTLFVLSLVILLLLTWRTAAGLIKPLGMMTDISNRLSRGDISLKGMSTDLMGRYLKRQDEIGVVLVSLNKLMDYLKEKEVVAKSIASGNLTVVPEIASDADDFGRAYSGMVSSLNTLITEINMAVQQVNGGAAQVSQASQALSQGATEQASSLEEISSSVTEITGQSRHNTENAQTVNQIAREAALSADKGNEKMTVLVQSMQEINQNAVGIKKIVKAIDDIAFQINLLALNANVEAARAGKYGKGFAVVAEEVRNLAVRSAKSVQETTHMVEEAIKSIEGGNKLVNETAQVFESIVNGARKVADLADEVAAATKEQTAGLNQISGGLGQIDQVTQSNTASAEETASASEELSGQANYLKSLVASFKTREAVVEGHDGVIPQNVLTAESKSDRAIKNVLSDKGDMKENLTDDFGRF